MSEPDPVPPPARSKRKRLAILAGALLLAAGGAGGAWYATREVPAAQAAQPSAVQKAPNKPLFTTLEAFTVNLQDPRGERFAQIGVTLQFDDPDTEVAIKDHLPSIRNDILMLISSKQVEELLSLEGKQQLAQQIRLRAGRALGVELPEPGASASKTPTPPNPIRQVLFSQFLVQ
jgi:flagellar protein FliL